MSNTIGKRSYYNCKRPLVLVRGGIGDLREVNFIRVDSDESHIIICRKIKQSGKSKYRWLLQTLAGKDRKADWGNDKNKERYVSDSGEAWMHL